MRTSLIVLPLVLCAGPALAQTSAQPAPQPQEVQRVLNDPAMVDRMTNVMQALGIHNTAELVLYAVRHGVIS